MKRKESGAMGIHVIIVGSITNSNMICYLNNCTSDVHFNCHDTFWL